MAKKSKPSKQIAPTESEARRLLRPRAGFEAFLQPLIALYERNRAKLPDPAKPDSLRPGTVIDVPALASTR